MAKKNTSKPRTFIDINGKRYDALSGQQINAVAPLISDVIMPTTPTVVSPGPLPKKQTVDVRPIHHLKRHRPEPAKTLMRTAVKKPAGKTTRLKAVTGTDVLANKPAAIRVMPKISIYHTDPRRKAHAARTAQSELVHRFAPGDIVTPTSAAAPTSAPRPTLTVSPLTSLKSPDVFERALIKADAHLESPVNPKKQAKLARKHARKTNKRPLRHRTTSVAAISLAVLLLTGFIAYQNKAALTVRYASAQAGFHASLPHYKPGGFALGKLSYQAGKVSMAFNNNVSRQSYTLSQQPSSWDSQTLLQNIVTEGQTYQTLQHQGQTIYIFDDNSAAWVNAGILYQLNSRGNLSTSQIIDLATSV